MLAILLASLAARRRARPTPAAKSRESREPFGFVRAFAFLDLPALRRSSAPVAIVLWAQGPRQVGCSAPWTARQIFWHFSFAGGGGCAASSGCEGAVRAAGCRTPTIRVRRRGARGESVARCINTVLEFVNH